MTTYDATMMAYDVGALMVRVRRPYDYQDVIKRLNRRWPLVPHAVIHSEPSESGRLLLQLPAEILANIVSFLEDDKPTLALLALANSDCRQLARRVQFASVDFDYSPQARNLMLHLANEARTESKKPRIGPCIRKLKFASRQFYVSTCHSDLHDTIYHVTSTEYTEEESEKIRKEANEYYLNLRDESLFAISSAMPNLKYLDWGDIVPVDANFFTQISHSSAQVIQLKNISVNDIWPMGPPLTPKIWPLSSLTIKISDRSINHLWQAGKDIGVSNFFETLFQVCASSLKSLCWTHSLSYEGMEPRTISFGHNAIPFPRLRQLRLLEPPLDARSVSSLLSSSLQHVELWPNIWTKHGKLISELQPFEHLETLVVAQLPGDVKTCTHVAKFILQHNHLQKLYLHETHKAYKAKAHLNEYIIPALAAGNFNNLQSLSLGWAVIKPDWNPGGPVIEETEPPKTGVPEKALAIIGQIVSLEQLRIMYGGAYGDPCNWLVNHDELRAHLQGLKRLKTLALAGDTYGWPPSDLRESRYYIERNVTPKEEEDAEARPMIDESFPEDEFYPTVLIWERAHRNRMLEQAEAYAEVLPVLDQIVCGQRLMQFEPGFPRKAVPITRRRNVCYEFYNRKFGITMEIEDD